MVRARRIQGGEGDTVIKLRPVDPETLPPEVRQSTSVKVEVDAMPKGFVCSASMKGKTTADDVRAVILKKMKIRDLFTKEQRALYKANAPDGLKLSELSVLGPINLLKLEFDPGRPEAQVRRRTVDVSRRLAHPRALDQGHARRRVPRRRRNARVPARRRASTSPPSSSPRPTGRSSTSPSC